MDIEELKYLEFEFHLFFLHPLRLENSWSNEIIWSRRLRSQRGTKGEFLLKRSRFSESGGGHPLTLKGLLQEWAEATAHPLFHFPAMLFFRILSAVLATCFAFASCHATAVDRAFQIAHSIHQGAVSQPAAKCQTNLDCLFVIASF